MHTRTEQLLGADAVERLRTSRVALFGLGGVGSFTAEALARAGVGHLLLVDGDNVASSNLNRQLVALHSTLGQPKADVMAARIRDIFFRAGGRAPSIRATAACCSRPGWCT